MHRITLVPLSLALLLASCGGAGAPPPSAGSPLDPRAEPAPLPELGGSFVDEAPPDAGPEGGGHHAH